MNGFYAFNTTTFVNPAHLPQPQLIRRQVHLSTDFHWQSPLIANVRINKIGDYVNGLFLRSGYSLRLYNCYGQFQKLSSSAFDALERAVLIERSGTTEIVLSEVRVDPMVVPPLGSVPTECFVDLRQLNYDFPYLTSGLWNSELYLQLHFRQAPAFAFSLEYDVGFHEGPQLSQYLQGKLVLRAIHRRCALEYQSGYVNVIPEP
ncbi:MAG: hypothetical protein ACYCOU_10275 [Sulfobacillus sp.]